MVSDEFLLRLPKTDLHVHLDGSLNLNSFLEMAKEARVELPSEEIFKDRYNGLDDYLKGFAYTCAVMQTKENIERISYELAIENQKQGVRYIEIRFAPQLFANSKLSMEEVFKACDSGLSRAQKEFNVNKNIINKNEPEFKYGIIACAMRNVEAYYSETYKHIFAKNTKESKSKIIAKAANELVKEVVRIRDTFSLPIVGIDLAGEEAGYPADNFIEAFSFCHKNFLHKTVHAGEAYGAESIFQAISDLHADRIGHGYYLFDEKKLGPTIINKQKYLKNLISFIAEKRITVEVCLTSNLQTNPNLDAIINHPFQLMLKNNIAVTLCTDNTLISKTSILKEYRLAADNFNLTEKDFEKIALTGFKRCFFSENYDKKKQYIDSIISYL